jgi:hypothetical protein
MRVSIVSCTPTPLFPLCYMRHYVAAASEFNHENLLIIFLVIRNLTLSLSHRLRYIASLNELQKFILRVIALRVEGIKRYKLW